MTWGIELNTREVVIFSGERYVVPQCIQRIDHLSTHGWQLRYGGTKLFSDPARTAGGARRALALATKECSSASRTLPAPSRLRRTPSRKKAKRSAVGPFPARSCASGRQPRA